MLISDFMNSSSTSNQKKTMLQCEPFKAWRYNPETIDIKKAIAPPYDVISPEKQKKLYETAPYNCIRLILNKKEDSDNEKSNIYTRARDFFKKWCEEKTLIQDEKSCYYIYRQSFKEPGCDTKKERYALLSRVKLESFDKGIIIPHEKTLKGPRADRMNLLKTAGTIFSPVFGLYEDTGLEMVKIIQSHIKNKPVFELEDDGGIGQALWIVRDEKTVEAVKEIMASKKVYIADGHHRYETALEYSRLKKEEVGGRDDSNQAYHFMMMALVSFSDPGFLLLPTHRIVTKLKGMNPKEALAKLREDFEVKEISSEEIEGIIESKETGSLVFVVTLKGLGNYLLTLKDIEKAKQKMPTGKPAIWYELNVNLLGHLILAALWGITEEQWESVLKFEHTVERTLKAVEGEEAEAAFLFKAPKVEMLEKMGAVGERMPQKSTYFYPKLASGITFYSHNN